MSIYASISSDLWVHVILSQLTLSELAPFASCSRESQRLFSLQELRLQALSNTLSLVDNVGHLYASLLLSPNPTEKELTFLRHLLLLHPEWANTPLAIDSPVIMPEGYTGDPWYHLSLLPLELVRNKRTLRLLLECHADLNAPNSIYDWDPEELHREWERGVLRVIGFTDQRKYDDDFYLLHKTFLPISAELTYACCLHTPSSNPAELLIRSSWYHLIDGMMLFVHEALPSNRSVSDVLVSDLLEQMCQTDSLSFYFPIRALCSQPESPGEVCTFTWSEIVHPLLLRLIAHYRQVSWKIEVEDELLTYPQCADFDILNAIHYWHELPCWNDSSFWQRKGYESREACRSDLTLPVLSFCYYKMYEYKLDYHQGRGFLCATSLLSPCSPSAIKLKLQILSETVTDIDQIFSIYGLCNGEVSPLLTDGLPVCKYTMKLVTPKGEITLQYNHEEFAQGVELARKLWC